MNDLTLEMQLAHKRTKEADSKENMFPRNHLMFDVATKKSTIGRFGENLVSFVEPDNWSHRTGNGNDKFHNKHGKCEIKTSKSSSTWFNQIYFDKDWDTLILINIGFDTVEAYYATKSQKLEEWEHFKKNNGLTFNREFSDIKESKLFKCLFEGTYRWKTEH